MSITLRSRRGAIGTAWQAVALRDALAADLRPGTANAGKRIARAGLVQWLDVSAGTARAEVRDDDAGGSVEARLEVTPLMPGDRRVLCDLALAHPELPARLAAGEYPLSFERELGEHEISLVPHGALALTHDCSCPDWPGPCAHVAALGYVLIEAVEDHPVHLLTLRGLTLEDIAPRRVGPTRAPDSAATDHHRGAGPDGPSERGQGDAVGAGSDGPSERGDDVGHEYLDNHDPENAGSIGGAGEREVGNPERGGVGGAERGSVGDPEEPVAPRFDPTLADARLLVDALGSDAARVLARFYRTALPDTIHSTGLPGNTHGTAGPEADPTDSD